MGNDKTILTALGLDVTQFESGTNRARSNLASFAIVLNGFDSELRKLPVVGELWAATGGKMVEVFANNREEAREFARIMRTDVSGSLEGTITQIDDLTESLGRMKVRGGAQWLQDKITNAARGFNNIFRGGNEGSVEQERDENIEQFDKKRTANLKNLMPLYEQEAKAHSEAYSQSLLASEQARIEMQFAAKRLSAEREAEKLGGPERAKWNKGVVDNLRGQVSLAERVRDADKAAAQTRVEIRRDELEASTTAAWMQHSGNQRDLADLELNEAMRRQARLRNAPKEDQEAAQAAVAIAAERVVAAQAEYAIATRQAELQTRVMELETTGQTRAANQAKIRLQYETQIADAIQHRNTALADELKKQQKSAQLAEAMRQVELGGGGRAGERREERRKAHIARIAQNRLDAVAANEALNAPQPWKDRMDKLGLKAYPTHLAKPGHMQHASLLDKVVKTKPTSPSVVVDGLTEFSGRLFKILEG